MSNSSKQIKFGAMISYLAIAINIISGLVYTPWMIAKLGQSDYGLYSLTSSLISMFMIDFGISSAVSRFLSKYRAEKNQEMIDNILGIIYKLFLIIDIVIFAILFVIYFFIDVIYKGLTPEEIEKLRVLYIIVGTFSIASFPFTTLSGILTAYEKFIYMKLCDIFHKLFMMGLIIASLYMGLGVVAVVVCNAISGIATIAIKLFIVKSKTPVKINFSYKSMQLLKEIFKFSLWITVFTVSERFVYTVAPSILGVVSTSEEIAFYSPAAMLSNYLYYIAVAINGLFLPKVSRNVARNDNDANAKLMVNVGRYQIAVLGLCFTGFLVIGKDFLSQWLSPEYTSTYYCAAFLMFVPMLDYPQQIAKTTIIAKNLVKWQALGLLASGLINIPLSLLVTSRFGSIGTSVVICFVMFMYLVYMNVVYIKVLGFDMKPFYKQVYLRMLLPMVLSVCVAHFLTNFIHMGGWFGIIVKGIVTVLVYSVFVLTFFVKKDDFKMFKSVLRRKK